MKVAICASSRSEIDKKYYDSSKKVLDYLTSLEDVELLWGDGSTSIMGLCYQEFVKNNKKIKGYTTRKYLDDLVNLDKADHTICNSTLDLKKFLLNDADVVVYLAGGTGTVSEFFAHLEEVRSNDVNRLLIMYNEDHQFDLVLELIDFLIKNKFNDEKIYNYFKVVNNIDEFKEIIKTLHQ